jgi:hypothetical protein
MSNLTTEVFGDMNHLYEHIANRDAQQLNENSDHFDEEASELVVDILATISSSMVYEGYSANAIITFLETSPEQDIIEKYLSFDENVITESVVSEDYIIEQLEIFDFAISEGWGSLIGKTASFIGRVASKPARMKAAERLATSNNPARTAAAYQKLANKNAAKAGFKPDSTDGAAASFKFKNTDAAARAASMSKPIAKVKDIAKGAKATLTSPTAKKVALGAAALGAATGAGYLGAKMAGAGDQSLSAKPNPVPKQQTPPPAPILPPPSNNGGGSSGSGAPSRSGGGSSNTSKKPVSTKQTGNPEKDTKTWAAANPKLAAAKAERDRTRGTQQSDNPLMKDMPGTRPLNSPSVQSPEVSKLGSGNQSLTNNPNAFKAATPPAPKASDKKDDKKSEKNESYDAYDLVLEYLFDNGHADTIAEAEYLMTELDESFIQSLVETYEANLLAEEVEAWVNELVEKGYDLSEYTWDDMVDYYFTEGKGDGNLANNYPPYDKVTRGDIIAGALGQDKMGGKNKSKKSKNC